MGNAQRVINSGVRGVVAAMAMSGTRALACGPRWWRLWLRRLSLRAQCRWCG